MEQFSNNAASTLTGTVNNSSDPVTLTVASASLFPAAGNFRILIDNEILLVTSVSGLNLTCARAQEGTTIATHSNGSLVIQAFTKGSLFQLLADMTLKGAFSSRPAAGVQGRKYHCTDCPFWYYDNGTTWDKYFGSYPIVTPDNTGFSWDDQGSATLTTTKDMLTIGVDGISSFRYKTAPSTPYTVEGGFLMNCNGLHILDCYLGFRNSVSGKIHTTGLRLNSGDVVLTSWKWTTSTVFASSYETANYDYPMGSLLLFKIEDDGVNRNMYVSMDGVNFTLFHSIGRTDFLTADQVVWGAGSDTASTTMSVSLIHWK